ncbi:MAG TPA: hypothetical protein VLR92_09900, partial [Blastocatellia bacterium]|nr:hypothetical protein [Blastocatellia bacterium]
EFARKIEADDFVIVESNSLRRFITPALYLQVLDAANPDFKVSAQQFFGLSDAYIMVSKSQVLRDPSDTELLAAETARSKPCFTVNEEDRFISKEVIEFVRSRLTLGAADVARRLQPAR